MIKISQQLLMVANLAGSNLLVGDFADSTIPVANLHMQLILYLLFSCASALALASEMVANLHMQWNL